MATGYVMLDAPNTFTPQGTFPRRGGHRPSGTCIMHTTEGNWQAGVAGLTRLVQTRRDYGCYHRGVDWADIERYYPFWWETWQDSETNNWAVGIAAACRTSDWGNMPPEIEEGIYRNLAAAAAEFVVYMKTEFGVTVPLRRISGAEARARVPGFCAHGDSGIARSDPGARFDWSRFFRYTQEKLNGKAEGFLMALTDKQQADLYWVLCTDDGRAALASTIARATLNYEVPWFGADGVIPPEGQRRTVNLTAVAGWIDTMIGGTNRNINATRDSVLEAIGKAAPQIELSDEQLDRLADKLRGSLEPGLARELGRRLQAEPE